MQVQWQCWRGEHNKFAEMYSTWATFGNSSWQWGSSFIGLHSGCHNHLIGPIFPYLSPVIWLDVVTAATSILFLMARALALSRLRLAHTISRFDVATNRLSRMAALEMPAFLIAERGPLPAQTCSTGRRWRATQDVDDTRALLICVCMYLPSCRNAFEMIDVCEHLIAPN